MVIESYIWRHSDSRMERGVLLKLYWPRILNLHKSFELSLIFEASACFTSLFCHTMIPLFCQSFMQTISPNMIMLNVYSQYSIIHLYRKYMPVPAIIRTFLLLQIQKFCCLLRYYFESLVLTSANDAPALNNNYC